MDQFISFIYIYTYYFNRGNFIGVDDDLSESDSDIEENNMLILGENLQYMQIPLQNVDTHLHQYTFLTDVLDIVPAECANIIENLQRDLYIYRFKIFLTDNSQVNHVTYTDMEDDIVLNDIIQYTNENYIQDCCSNPYHTSMKRMHGSLTLNSIPSATFDPDSANPQTQRFLSPIYIFPFINQIIFGERYQTSYVSEHLYPWIYCTFSYDLFLSQYFMVVLRHQFAAFIAQSVIKLTSSLDLLR